MKEVSEKGSAALLLPLFSVLGAVCHCINSFAPARIRHGWLNRMKIGPSKYVLKSMYGLQMVKGGSVEGSE